MKKYLIVIFFLISLTSCKKTEFEPKGPTDVRVKNISDQNFTEVVVKIKDESFALGDIAKGGGISEYFRFETAFAKADISAKINGVVISTDPVDYTYLNYQGQIKITYEVWIVDTAQGKKLEIHDVIPEGPLVLK
jgi:hypothetical protein